jgi:hypothetical protein
MQDGHQFFYNPLDGRATIGNITIIADKKIVAQGGII